ncbi:MAG: hypothetical protein ACO3OM_07335 [Alphaproteobacteria bacterium]
MGTQVRSISQTGATEPFELQVARGQIEGHKHQFKFGHNALVSNTEETIWAQGGIYAYPPGAQQMTLSSSSDNDTANEGTGARTVEISGLDADYNEQSETLLLNGQTPVTTTKSFLRTFRMRVLTAGDGLFNQGTIYLGTGTVTAGVPAVKYATIDGFGDNQTMMCLWTVPAGYTAFLLQSNISTGNGSSTPAVLRTRLISRPHGETFQTKERITMTDGNQLQNYSIPLRFEEKTDIEFRAVSSTNVDFDVSASMEFVYIKNPGGL